MIFELLFKFIAVRGKFSVGAECRASPWRGRNAPEYSTLIYSLFQLSCDSNGHAKARPYSISCYR